MRVIVVTVLTRDLCWSFLFLLFLLFLLASMLALALGATDLIAFFVNCIMRHRALVNVAALVEDVIREEHFVDVGQDTAVGKCNCAEQLVELFVIAHSQENVARDDARTLVVASSVAGQLEDFSGKVLHNRSQIDGSSSANTSSIATLAKEAGNTANGELQTSARGARHGLATFCFAAASFALASTSLGRSVLGDCFGALRNGVLGEFTRNDETDGGLDFTRAQRALSVVAAQTTRFGGEALENIVHKGVHDGHGATRNAGIRVHLLQHLVDVGRVSLGATLAAELLAIGANLGRFLGLLAALFLLLLGLLLLLTGFL